MKQQRLSRTQGLAASWKYVGSRWWQYRYGIFWKRMLRNENFSAPMKFWSKEAEKARAKGDGVFCMTLFGRVMTFPLNGEAVKVPSQHHNLSKKNNNNDENSNNGNNNNNNSNNNTIQSICESTEELTKGKDYDFLHPWMGKGIVFAWDFACVSLQDIIFYKTLSMFQCLIFASACSGVFLLSRLISSVCDPYHNSL